MARGTRYGGASLTPEEAADPASPQPIRVRRPELGVIDRPAEEETEEPPSVGTNSSPSLKSEKLASGSSRTVPRKPAQTTENLSSQPEQGEDSTAPTTDTDGPTRRAARSGKARVRTTDDDDLFD